MLFTALGMDTGKASLGEPTLWGRRMSTKRGLVAYGPDGILEHHAAVHALRWISCWPRVLGQGAESGNQARSRHFSASAGASTACHEHHATSSVTVAATVAVAKYEGGAGHRCTQSCCTK